MSVVPRDGRSWGIAPPQYGGLSEPRLVGGPHARGSPLRASLCRGVISAREPRHLCRSVRRIESHDAAVEMMGNHVRGPDFGGDVAKVCHRQVEALVGVVFVSAPPARPRAARVFHCMEYPSHAGRLGPSNQSQ